MLLSLLLVFSQQMGYAHALTHATTLTGLALSQTLEAAVPDTTQEPDRHLDGITKLGFDHSCAQCLAVAQFTAAVDTRFHSFALLDGVAVIGALAPVALLPATPRTAYHSRAPPELSC